MKQDSNGNRFVTDVRRFFQLNNSKLNYVSEEPLRAELFSTEQMERFGKTLAHSHKLSPHAAKDYLLQRLEKNETILHEVRKLLTDSLRRRFQISPAAEWLIDNFYLLEDNIRSAQLHFPREYSEKLPHLLVHGDKPGQTRVYDIALQFISHSDGKIDQHNLSSFIRSYQSATNLMLGELWAIPIMLRLALIENLRRVSSQIAIDRIDRNLADYWARQMIDTAEKDPRNLILVVADMARSNPPMVSAFVSELARQLRGRGPDLALALNWTEQQLSDAGLTSEELINAEIQKQAADQVSMSNSIESLRLLGSLDWGEFVEEHSVVEQVLREDPTGTYPDMDFFTRDRYRHVIEHIAARSKFSEYEIARIAIKLSQDHEDRSDERKRHVGYYLIDDGLRQTRRQARMRVPLSKQIKNRAQRNAFPIYVLSVCALTALMTFAIVFNVRHYTFQPAVTCIVAALALIATSELAKSLVDFFSTLFVSPRLLPRMDFSNGIPAKCRTMVVVPIILDHVEEIAQLVDALEVRYLANRKDNLYYALLTDFNDAREEHLEGDDDLVKSTQELIAQLNKKYHRDKNDLFYFFHRPRRWNFREKVWMGYERKRGKLSELNDLLRGKGEERFSVIFGDRSVFSSVRYIVTLDADTQLPLGSVWKLIGSMAHPLNAPLYNHKKKRVTKGYGILQPRVTVSLPDSSASPYARMHGNEPGIDPYTRASSDLYQDLFDEGSYIGKGIYDVDIFREVLEGRFAENCILSHDLLEGCYARSGLLSDVQLFEKYPASYRADMKRRERWVRGDWQILTWTLPFVREAKRRWQKNPISLLSRWKVFDNLRRSLVPASLMALLLLSWTLLSSPLTWIIVVTLIVLIPVIVTTTWDTLRKPKDVVFIHHAKRSFKNISAVTLKTIFTLICLPFEAYSNLRAIGRTLWRMFVTRKKLLEWNPSAWEEERNPMRLTGTFNFMWPEPFLALIAVTYIALYHSDRLIVSLPIICLWFLSPLLAWKISEPARKRKAELTEEQINFLRKAARKTWGYFEQFVTEQDNWLPPDNFQEQPEEKIAHRTSLTNIGFALLSNIAAREFGYITTLELISRTNKTISTLEKMERYRGHFYNWYDTISLAPLLPKYISTVDSGNFVLSLLLLKEELLGIPHRKMQRKKLLYGLRDTYIVLKDSLNKETQESLKAFEEKLNHVCTMQLITYQELKVQTDMLAGLFHSPHAAGAVPDESAWWVDRVRGQLALIEDEYQTFLPWVLIEKAPKDFREQGILPQDPTPDELLESLYAWKQIASAYKGDNEWIIPLREALDASIEQRTREKELMENLIRMCNEYADPEWDFLFDRSRNLFTIGYTVQEHEQNESHYDLLASEARLCAFIGIAQGKIPEESWFALGRLLTNVNGNTLLLSWSGSMFEYLMPMLVMPTYENTLLGQTCKSAVQWQIDYGKQVNLPWGISESGYNMFNAISDYQYRAFGAPGLGLKRGLEEDAVIAPYASALALMVEPEKSCSNLQLLAEKGMLGRYGFYEAIDYTNSRLPRGQSSAIVYQFMAHHQGMSLLSYAWLLLDRPMQKLFEAEPQFKAALLLLQERVPEISVFYRHTTEIEDISYTSTGTESRVIKTANTTTPQVQLLSNGKYHVMITNSGAGYSRWKDLAVTRWREDTTRDNWGMFCYIRNVKTGDFWSATYQPALVKGDHYEAVFSQGRADFRMSKHELEAHTTVIVSPEDDVEIRRVVITNHSAAPQTIELTSYAEVVLAPQAADMMAPAFSNLFVETEVLPEQHAIICTRRPRSAEEVPPWMFHLVISHGRGQKINSFETDRMQFIGRANSLTAPQEVRKGGPLSGHDGPVLDPIVSIRYRITLAPQEKYVFDMLIGVTETKEGCLSLIDKYQDHRHLDRAFELSWTHSQVVLRQIGASETDAQLYCRLASSLIYASQLFRADPSILISNHRGQSGLWGYSISGDLPIVLLKTESGLTDLHLVHQVIQAHSYWRLKGLIVDLVIWNEAHEGYRQEFQNAIEALVPVELKDRPGGIFVRSTDHMPTEDRILFQTVARVIFSGNTSTFANLVKRKLPPKVVIPALVPSAKRNASASANIYLPDDLLFCNGHGGFTKDGREYVIIVGPEKQTPLPWVNVIANPNFGTVISENGSAYSWVENAHELRLSPWFNDPVSDQAGEAFYLRDESTGHFWSPGPFPASGTSAYLVRHGFGYSVYRHIEDQLLTEMTVYVDLHEPIKFVTIKIHNHSAATRKLTVTGYIEWVLGENRVRNLMHTRTEIDPETGAVFASNNYNPEFQKRVAFFDVDQQRRTVTGDRAEFIGRNNDLERPQAMYRQKLSGKVGLGLDPCGAIMVPVELASGEEREIIFRLGAGKDHQHARELARHFEGPVAARSAFEKSTNFWQNTVEALQVHTPDAGINLLVNGWLNYQTLSSRLWGRSGFYQSGGAFGYRDQLQDVLSLLFTRPELARDQLLLAASRQFKKGDVQHWWHPPIGRGVRTRCSDDYLWLPFVASEYISHTGDTGVLDETVPFLEGRLLAATEESYYDLPTVSQSGDTLYKHCVLAIRHAFRFGKHGLPLMGSGDWNDGYDRVGIHGEGESVWLAFFLYDILLRFEKTAMERKDTAFAEECRTQAAQLKKNVEQSAWDGEWYIRAWFDDGTPLGSSSNEEGRIDSIAQSWAMLSGAGTPQRVQTALESAYRLLVKKEAGIIQLLQPPFDTSTLNPGYIKGYVPGVRENGGQYSHAAIWLIMAYAKQGNATRVAELISLINPVYHSNTPEAIATYKVEPYVLAADVYANEKYQGRGGWTWYTGSAAWLYQLLVESFIGLNKNGNRLSFTPCIPPDWESLTLDYRYGKAVYHILIRRQQGNEAMRVSVNGELQPEPFVTLSEEMNEHQVEVVFCTNNIPEKTSDELRQQ